MDKTEQLRKIKDEIVNFTQSPLYAERVRNKVFPVIGEGSHDAKIMFIGEAPGANEAKSGKPFCGASGKVLDKLLASIGLDRKDVYVTNVVKDRPPKNRDPLKAEIDLYSPFLWRQINIIKPKVICTLGRFAMNFVMKKFDLEDQITSISKMHGMRFTAECEYGEVDILPLYHPAVALYNANEFPRLQQDFEGLRAFCEISGTDKM